MKQTPSVSFSVLLHRARNWDPRTAPKIKTSQSDSLSAANDRFRDILTSEELADRLKVSVGWIYEKRRPRCNNPIPTMQPREAGRFNWIAVVGWLAQQAKADLHKARAERRKM